MEEPQVPNKPDELIEKFAGGAKFDNKFLEQRKVFLWVPVTDESSERVVNRLLFLEASDPGSFDLIFCQDFFEQCDILLFFTQLKRLRPRHVILDTGMVSGEGPLIRFSLGVEGILAIPNHRLIMFL